MRSANTIPVDLKGTPRSPNDYSPADALFTEWAFLKNECGSAKGLPPKATRAQTEVDPYKAGLTGRDARD